jgi:hypothetical protein
MTDGPYTETKEVIGGYFVVETGSLGIPAPSGR